MNNIEILDCTLRDGGRIIDCKFADDDIKEITARLTEAKVDVIEMGFLRDPKKVTYSGNSTFFTKVSQIEKFIPENREKTQYTAFIDYSMFDFSTLEKCNKKSVTALRIGFTKYDFVNDYTGLVEALKLVKKLGYVLYVQGVNSLAYTDAEFLKVIDMVNMIKPDVFAIVDTYGAMYIDDLQHIFRLTNKNLEPDIKVAFHSHNNFQMSFALAQEFIRLGNESHRHIVIDSTLNGMGKCAGNLNTELITDFLVRKKFFNYDVDAILDIIDDYMYTIKQNKSWGYSIPSMMAAIYQSHPNNVIYLTEKFRLATKDIKHIISMLPPEKRKQYDYDLIKNLYIEHNHMKVDDKKSLSQIKKYIKDKEILLLFPGRSILEYKDKIEKFIKEHNPVVIPINFTSRFLPECNCLPFFGSAKRYKKFIKKDNKERCIVVSNILDHRNEDYVVNYESLIDRDNDNFDSSSIMILNLLNKLDPSRIIIAGLDGFTTNSSNYFDQISFEDGRFSCNYEKITENTAKMLKNYAKRLQNKKSVSFITPSCFENIFKDNN